MLISCCSFEPPQTTPIACQPHANRMPTASLLGSLPRVQQVSIVSYGRATFPFVLFSSSSPLGAESDELQRTPGNLEETIRIVVDHLKYLKPSKTLNILHETKQDFIVLQGLRCFNVFFQEFVVRKLVKSQAVEATPSGTAWKVVRCGKQHWETVQRQLRQCYDCTIWGFVVDLVMCGFGFNLSWHVSTQLNYHKWMTLDDIGNGTLKCDCHVSMHYADSLLESTCAMFIV